MKRKKEKELAELDRNKAIKMAESEKHPICAGVLKTGFVATGDGEPDPDDAEISEDSILNDHKREYILFEEGFEEVIMDEMGHRHKPSDLGLAPEDPSKYYHRSRT